MSVALRQAMAQGSPRQVLRALSNPRNAPDHEDIVLCLKNVLELVDELADELAELRARLPVKEKSKSS